MLSSMDELHKNMLEAFAEVDSRPKNIYITDEEGNPNLSMYDIPLSVKVQLEALAAHLYEMEIMSNREVV